MFAVVVEWAKKAVGGWGGGRGTCIDESWPRSMLGHSTTISLANLSKSGVFFAE